MAQDATKRFIKPLGKAIYDSPGQTEVNRRIGQFWRSDLVEYDDTTTVNVFSIPGNVMVVGGFVQVVSAFDASGSSAAATATLTVPNDTGTETIFNAANTALQSSGLHPCTAFAITPDSGGDVALSYTAGTTTAGSLYVYLEVIDPTVIG
jgi:hypothetical protein